LGKGGGRLSPLKENGMGLFKEEKGKPLGEKRMMGGATGNMKNVLQGFQDGPLETVSGARSFLSGKLERNCWKYPPLQRKRGRNYRRKEIREVGGKRTNFRRKTMMTGEGGEKRSRREEGSLCLQEKDIRGGGGEPSWEERGYEGGTAHR